jgi:hypothetical protein
MARNKIPAGRRKKLGAATIPKRSAVPDRLDLRDRLYLPPVAVVPGVTFAPKTNIPVLDQGQTNACTGFALASVVYQLQHSAKRKQIDCCVAHLCCIRWHGAMMNFPAPQMLIPDRVCAAR